MPPELLGAQSQVQEQTQTKKNDQAGLPHRPYIHELDHLRVVTMLDMVAVHILVFPAFFHLDSVGIQVVDSLYNMVRLTRMIFMFVTGVALVSTYYGKPFSFTNFWKKRSIGVLVPYVFWTIIYTAINDPQPSPWGFLITTLGNLLTGDGSLQLYYMVLILQFYLLLPGFLWLLRRAQQHPWTLVGVSFALQLILWAVDYYTLETNIPTTGFWGFVAHYQYRFVFTYQLYFVLGGMVALHLQAVRAWLLTHRAWVIAAAGVTLTARTLVFVFQFDRAHTSLGYAVEVVQPVMVFYSVSVIAFLYWLAYRSVRKHDQQRQSKRQRFWHIMSDASFGIYLVHPIVMGLVLILVIFPLASWLPGLVCVALTWLLTAIGSVAWSMLFMNLPILSRLVGRPRRMSDKLRLIDWLKPGFRSAN